MADVFVEYSDLEISKADVFGSDDVEELKEWFREQSDTGQELAIMIGALRLAEHANTAGLARKLGYVNISICWLKRRLKELGVEGEEFLEPKEKRLQAHIKMTEEALQKAKAKIKELNIENTSLRQKAKLFSGQPQ